jgi:hypothetical protein
MTAPAGASPVDWAHWDLVLGLGADLLPVVCEPGLPVSPSSALVTYGKVPSRFDREGRVVGFPKWTQYQATDRDLETWRQDPRLGICLQTRRVRAIDVDVEDAEAAHRIAETITEAVGVLPCRTRANSHKFLLVFEMEGDYAKQILQTPAGAIEFLAGGQQCLVEGTHPSGARYQWSDGLPRTLPPLTRDQFLLLQSVLRRAVGTADWSEGRVRRARTEGSDALTADDPVVAYLRETGWVRV